MLLLQICHKYVCSTQCQCTHIAVQFDYFFNHNIVLYVCVGNFVSVLVYFKTMEAYDIKRDKANLDSRQFIFYDYRYIQDVLEISSGFESLKQTAYIT